MTDETTTHWHLDKRLNISHMITTAGMLAAAFLWASDVEQRIGENTQSIQHTKELMQVEQKHVKDTVEKIDDKVDKLDGKMDKLLDKVNGK